MELDSIKDQLATKIEIQKEKVLDENRKLIEDSGDLDRQISLFQKNMLEDKVDTSKYDIDDEYREKLGKFRKDQSARLDRERERVEIEMQERLDREMEKEKRRAKMESNKIQDKKDDIER